jgi:hypothetical protein
MLSKVQRIILAGAAALVVIAFLWPPFHLVLNQGTFSGGFHFLLESCGKGVCERTVNVPLLLAEWLGIVLVAVLLCVVFNNHGVVSKEPSSTDKVLALLKHNRATGHVPKKREG